jgi:hypothetical protein
VAPERVQRGLAQALPRRNPFGIEGLGDLMLYGADRNSILAQLRFELSAMDNGWNQWVLNYTPERQRGVLDSLRSGVMNWRTLAVAAAGMLLVWFAYAMRERRRGDPVDALYSAMCLQLSRLGMARGADEGPNAYRERIDISRLEPQHKNAAAHFLRLYSAYKYGAQPPDPALAATLKNLLTKFR